MLVIACVVLAIQLGGSLGQGDLVLDTDWSNNVNTPLEIPAQPLDLSDIDISAQSYASQGSEYGRWTKRSETLTLDFTSCEGWTYTAITENIIEVTFEPEEFPADCSPEKDLLITSHFFTKGDCPTGKKCENEEDKLINGTDICAYSDTMMQPFISNSKSSTKEYFMKSKPVCSEEKKVLFAMKSLCIQPVKVHIKIETRLVKDSFEETCDSPAEKALFVVFAVVVGIAGLALIIFLRVRRIRRLRRIYQRHFSSFQMISHVPPPAAGHANESQPLTANQGPASTQLPSSLHGADAKNATNPRNNDYTPL